MKIRTGFVTNSSSSSFLVAFDEVPKTIEELHEMMFGKEASSMQLYNDFPEFGTYEIAEDVFKDIIKSSPLTKLKEVSLVFSEGYFDSDLDFDSFKNEDGSTDWSLYTKARNELAKKAAKGFREKTKGKLVYLFQYSDNDGHFYSMMEHGNIFYKLIHQRISHH